MTWYGIYRQTKSLVDKAFRIRRGKQVWFCDTLIDFSLITTRID